jgi:hypothetical protein
MAVVALFYFERNLDAINKREKTVKATINRPHTRI